MNIRPRMEVRQTDGLFRVIARTAGSGLDDRRHFVPNPEPLREYVHKRTFTDNGEAWRLALRVEHALRADRTLDLRHWDIVIPGDLPADSLLPASYHRWVERALSQQQALAESSP